MALERRKFRRETPEDLQVSSLGNGSMQLLDISAGGFSCSSSHAFDIGTRHAFQFTTSGSLTLTLQASAVHALRIQPGDAPAVFVCGFAFAAETADQREAIAMLVDGLNDGTVGAWPELASTSTIGPVGRAHR